MESITMTDETNDLENVDTDNVEETTTEATAPAEGTPTPVGGPGLTLGDLRLVARIIQISGERGAIRADEMATVGDLYNRLVQWLNAIQPAPAPAPTSDTPVAGTDELSEENETPTEESTDSDEGNTGE
jgi:hypothetical protein